MGADPDDGAGARAAHPGQRHRPRPGAAQYAADAGAVRPASRLGAARPRHQPDEIARAVLAILALPAMTGQMLALDGGQHLQWQPGRQARRRGVDADGNPRIASSARALRHVFLRDLVLTASIGVHPHEHAAPQRVRINVDLGVEDDGARACRASRSARDELTRVVDYEKLAEQRARHCRRRPCPAGGDPGGADRRSLPGGPARSHLARIRVEKLDIFADAASAGVEIERRQSRFVHAMN